MATRTQVQNFISQLSALAIAEAKKRDKWVLPSVCIAQAALETGWGTSGLMTKANAYFGIKAFTGWKGKVYNAGTSECYDGKTYTNITACFRAYDSVAESVEDYFNLICGLDRYKLAVNEKDARKAITAIKNGGYATSPTYIQNVMSIIEQYNLTQYDSEIVSGVPVSKPSAPVVEPVVSVSGAIKVGDAVRLNKGAKTYTGGGVASFVYNRDHVVKEISGDRAVITFGGIVVAAVKVSDLTLVSAGNNAPAKPAVPAKPAAPAPATPVKTIKVGSTVRLNKGAKTYNGKGLASFIYNRNHKVKEINGDRVVITFGGVVVAAVKLSDLTLID